MSIENSFVNTQNDYSAKRQDIVPSYIFSRIYQQTGGQNVTIDTSNPESIFELPPRVINLFRSILKFTATPAAGGGGNFNWMFQDCFANMRQVQLLTRGNQIVMDINNIDKYSKITLKTDVKKSDTTELDIANYLATTLVNNTRYGTVGGSVTTYKYDGPEINPSVFKPVYIIPGGQNISNPYVPTANTATPILNVSLPLSQIKNTIFDLDKDLYFNEVMLLRIVWNPYTSWGFLSTSVTDPTAGVAALAANIAITNLTLKLALQNNFAISASLINKVRETGMEIVIPYVYPFKYTASGTPTQQNITLRINGTNGRHLKKIYHSLFNATEAIATRYNNSNSDQTNIVSYYTLIDNERRQQFDQVTANSDDFEYVRQNTHGTVISTNCDIYRYNWCIIEKFDTSGDDSVDCVDSGLPLDVEHKWDLVATTSAANYNHYSFAVCSRILSITPMGISIHS